MKSPVTTPAAALPEPDLLLKAIAAGDGYTSGREFHPRTLDPDTCVFPREVVSEIHASTPTVGAATGGECEGGAVIHGLPCPCSSSVGPGYIGREGSKNEFVPSEVRNRRGRRWSNNLLRRDHWFSSKDDCCL